MFSQPHRGKPIDSIVQGFTDKEVLVASLSGRLDDRIQQLGAALKEIQKHEHSIHSVEQADQIVADAKNTQSIADANKIESERLVGDAGAEAANMIARAEVRAKEIINKEIDARTATSAEAKRMIDEVNKEVTAIHDAAETDLIVVNEETSVRKSELTAIIVDLKEAKRQTANIRVALSDALRLTDV